MTALQLSIDPSAALNGARVIKRELGEIADAAERVERALTKTGGGGVVVRRTADDMAAALNKGATANDNFTAAANRASQSMTGFEQAVGMAKRALGALGIALGIRELSMFADSWSDLSARVGLAIGSMEAAPIVMQRLAAIADNTYSSLELTSEAFVRNSASLRELGLSTEQQLRYLSSLNDALVVSGARGDRARQVQDALSKAMVLGKLSGDELNAVMVHGGAIFGALAEEMGVSQNALRQLGAEGKISGSIIQDTLLKRVDEFREKAGLMPATIEDGLGRIRNAILQTVGVFDQQNALSESVAEGFVAIADGIKAIPAYIDDVARAGAVMAVALSPVIIGGIASALTAMGAAGVAAMTAITAAVAANPLGALAVAITTTISALYFFRDEIASVLGVDLVEVARQTANEFIGLFVGAYEGVKSAWGNLPNFMSGVAKEAWNSLIAEFEQPLLTANGITLIPGLDLSSLRKQTSEVERMAMENTIVAFSDGFRAEYIPAAEAAAAATRTAEDAAADLNAILGETPVAANGAGQALTDEMKRAQKAFEDQRRSVAETADALQRQITMFDASAGATQRLELYTREMARAWSIAREAGLDALPPETIRAIEDAANRVGTLTDELERLNLQRGQDDAMRMLQAEAGLIGMSAEARRVAMAGLEAEQRLRSQNISTTDEWGQAYIRNAQNAAGMRVEIDRQTKAYETQNQFVENVLSTSLDALFNVGKAESWGDAVLGIFADIGRQFQELAKQNLMQALFGQNYTTGQLAPGQRSIAQPGFPAGFGSVPVAANQNMPAGGALNIGAVQALNTNLQRSSRSALDVARQFDGLNERADSAVLDSFMQASGNWRNLSAADTAWCAAFANAAIVEAGGRGTGSNLASSFMGWGQGTNAPQVGDIVVLKPQSAGASGHVGFVAGFGDGKVQVFGGNQSNAANTRSFGLDQVRGYRTGVGVGGAGIGGSFAMPQMAVPVYAPQMSSAAQQAMAQGWSGFGPVPGQAGRSTVGMFGQGGRLQQFMQSPIGQLGMQGIGAFGAGYSSGSTGGGALQGGLGAFLSSGFNPVAGVVGLVGGALGGLFGGRKKREQEHQQKAQAWDQMAPQWAEYQRMLREDTGPSSGLRANQLATANQLTQFVGVGSAAWKRGSNNSSEIFAQTGADAGSYFERTNQAFQRRYWGTLDSLENGRGMAGPFVEAQDAITELGKTLSTFVDDTRLVFGDGSVEAQRAAEASISQLRAMLTGGRELTEVGEAVQRMEGAAAALRYELTQLGVSAEDAGSAVSADLASAMGQLRGDFAQGIQDQLWSLDGKGYIAEFRQFFTDIDGAIQDALLVGADRGLVDELFVRQAQSMVDGAQLSGDAFAELITAMPRLSGVVREFSAAAEEAAKRTTDQIDALRLSYGDRTFEASNDNSTEAGSLARFDRYAAREREEELRLGGEAILDLERALAAERGQIVKQFADRAAEAMKSAIERYDDRAFAATNTDDLAAFERQIAREREEAVRLGGDALVAFERMAAAERGQIVKAQADLAREQMQALDLSRYDAALRARADAENVLRQEYQRTVSFVDDLKGFLDGIRLDQDLSTLSATDRLAEAEKQYRETLALAQGGDKDAQDRLVSSSEAYLREARDYYATSERYGEIYAEINGSLKSTVAKAETDLDLARRQAGSLVDLVTGQKSMTVLLAEYLKAAQEVMSQFGRVNESRGWGTNETYNRSLVDALSKAGLNYTGSFGQGGYQSWLAGLSPADRQRAEGIGSGLSGAPASRNWGANAAANQGYVNALAGVGLNYSGAFGSGGFQSYLGGLSAVDRERARGVLGFQSGGFTGMGPTNAVAGVVHGQEFVAHAEATRRWRPQLEAMNAGRLPEIAMPRVMAGGGNSEIVAELRALRTENAELRREVEHLGVVIQASDDATRQKIGEGNVQAKKAANAAALAA